MKHSVAIIGLGFVGRAHLESLRRLGIPVKGGMLSTAERGSSAAKSLGLEKSYASLAELAADKEITCVHICSPNHVHFEQASALLRAGKHVLCEKPLAMDSRESQMLKAIEKETGFVGGVAHNLRYYPLCQEARALVASGAIGKPTLVHGKFHQDWLLYPTDWNWRLESKLGGELRAVSDIGTHWMDLAMFITGSRNTANGSLIKDPSLMSPAARGYAAYPGGHTEGYPDTFVQLFKDFYAYLDAGDHKAPRSFPTFSPGHDELILCETIAESAQKRAWLEIPDRKSVV